jgi:hypothetical protein
MPGVTPFDVTLNQFLTDFALGYRTPGLVAFQVFPVVSVPHQ